MMENDLSVALRERLRQVNAEWRALTREKGDSKTKLDRMGELRLQRLALMTELFDVNRARRGQTRDWLM